MGQQALHSRENLHVQIMPGLIQLWLAYVLFTAARPCTLSNYDPGRFLSERKHLVCVKTTPPFLPSKSDWCGYPRLCRLWSTDTKVEKCPLSSKVISFLLGMICIQYFSTQLYCKNHWNEQYVAQIIIVEEKYFVERIFAVFFAHTTGTICGHWCIEIPSVDCGRIRWSCSCKYFHNPSTFPGKFDSLVSFIDQPPCGAWLETNILLYRESFESSAEKYY